MMFSVKLVFGSTVLCSGPYSYLQSSILKLVSFYVCENVVNRIFCMQVNLAFKKLLQNETPERYRVSTNVGVVIDEADACVALAGNSGPKIPSFNYSGLFSCLRYLKVVRHSYI